MTHFTLTLVKFLKLEKDLHYAKYGIKNNLTTEQMNIIKYVEGAADS